MNYRYDHRRRVIPLWTRTAFIILALFFLFLAGLAQFRREDPASEEPEIPTADEIIASLAPTADGEDHPTPRGIPEEAQLYGVGEQEVSGVAKRVFENDVYMHTILAYGLPEIDATQFRYQGWIIRRFPLDFIPTERLVHNEDGSWGMIWVGRFGETYDEFVEVLVTLEPEDADENPSIEHVLNGSF
ncbi:MAG: hypothetical protein UY95_C0012G0004 [Parcubacteria group bacterium GW2011_GWA2_56_7]|nr:MAG: hypothetical protein UY95_C0012G0004 [Parcubacteria group bacterium GW2011_GWA2_56_7]